MSTEGAWHLEQKDGFDIYADPFWIGTPFGTKEEALAAADVKFDEIELWQPAATSGGQDGIADRLYLVHPDGTRERLYPQPNAS